MAKLNPYLSFRSEAKDALAFYQSVLGGELDISTFGGVPMEGMPTPDEDRDLVMHGQLDTPGGLTIMAADTPSFMAYVAPTAGVTVALTGGPEDHDYIRGAYEKLSDGATPSQPLELAPWGDYYGALTDKFGIAWMFDIGTEESAAG
ncbi:VOC family protein [Promicromonospora citrea]|uniref:VOC family protein n=1 Tax=Promicromonospora citrea TaxID=43677 RepID=A0A8H9L3G2_9MICO|nr:VOC family protein [Promicromonospora citrea]NNH54782.1 VOC family protein [Promicromonospora citrea]GGM19477.1 VOC family protein [Promicromonospora citrea]